jgi:hypothetical protein
MSQPLSESIKPRLYEVLGGDQHKYFIGVIEQVELKKFIAPIPAVRIGETGFLIAPDEQVKQYNDLKQKIVKELLRQIEIGRVEVSETDTWFNSPFEAVEACLYQPVTSCIISEVE